MIDEEKRRANLRQLHADLALLANNPVIINTQADRHLAIALVRLIEIQTEGEATTPFPGTHHE